MDENLSGFINFAEWYIIVEIIRSPKLVIFLSLLFIYFGTVTIYLVDIINQVKRVHVCLKLLKKVKRSSFSFAVRCPLNII